MFKIGDKIKFTEDVKHLINIGNHTYYRSIIWKEVDYMIITRINTDKISYTIQAYDTESRPIEQLSTGQPKKDHIIYYYNYNIEKIIKDLDKLKEKLDGKLVSNISS